jgi:hypothetical protein
MQKINLNNNNNKIYFNLIYFKELKPNKNMIFIYA